MIGRPQLRTKDQGEIPSRMLALGFQSQSRSGPRWFTRLTALIWTLRSGKEWPSVAMIGAAAYRNDRQAAAADEGSR